MLFTESTEGTIRGRTRPPPRVPKKNPGDHEDRRGLGNGAGEETRTLDVHLGKVVLYQLSYARKAGCKH